jgi:hypothetical protein
MTEDFAVLGTSGERDRDGSKLRGALETHLRLEHARGLRELSVGLVAALGLPVWVAAARPDWMARGLRTFVLTAWFVALVGLVTAAISEWRWRRRLDSFTGLRRGP